MEAQQYFERIEQHRKSGELDRALILALECVNRFPDNNRARLLLGRIFYGLGFLHFAAREVEILRERLPESESIRKLLEELAPHSTPSRGSVEGEITVAEDEVSIDDIDLDEDK